MAELVRCALQKVREGGTKEEWKTEVMCCKLMERDFSQVKHLRCAGKQKEDETWWLMTTYPVTHCFFPGQRIGETGRSHHFAGITTAGLNGWCAWVDNAFSVFWKAAVASPGTAQSGLSRGHLPALPHRETCSKGKEDFLQSTPRYQTYLCVFLCIFIHSQLFLFRNFKLVMLSGWEISFIMLCIGQHCILGFEMSNL